MTWLLSIIGKVRIFFEGRKFVRKAIFRYEQLRTYESYGTSDKLSCFHKPIANVAWLCTLGRMPLERFIEDRHPPYLIPRNSMPRTLNLEGMVKSSDDVTRPTRMPGTTARAPA